MVDQSVENQLFVESLMQLRSHHQALHQKYQQQANNAKQQLIHVNALLADSLVILSHKQQPISIQAATLEKLALIRANLVQGEELQKQSPSVAQKPESPKISDQQITSDVSQGVGDGTLTLERVVLQKLMVVW